MKDDLIQYLIDRASEIVEIVAASPTDADVTALRGRIALGDEVVLIGRQGTETVTADALAEALGTINYEVVTAISERVPRIASEGGPGEAW